MIGRALRWLARPKVAIPLLLMFAVTASLIWAFGDWPFSAPASSTGQSAGAAPVPVRGGPAFEMLATDSAPALIVGALGGILASWFVFSGYRKDLQVIFESISRRLESLESSRDELARQISNLIPRVPDSQVSQRSAAGSIEEPAYALSHDRFEEVVAPSNSVQRAPSVHPQAALAPTDTATIVRNYNDLAKGRISRAEFAAFFEKLGVAGPVEVVDEGRTIARARHDDAPLISVLVRDRVLVFPSYYFAVNFSLQFSTMASVPEGVARLFDLAPTGGDLVLGRPATFVDRHGEFELIERGLIEGFSG